MKRILTGLFVPAVALFLPSAGTTAAATTMQECHEEVTPEGTPPDGQEPDCDVVGDPFEGLPPAPPPSPKPAS